MIYYSVRNVQWTILADRDNADVDNPIYSCPEPILMHLLHQQLLQADTETPPYNPLKTQESWRIHRQLTVEENMLDCCAKGCRIIISGKHSLWRDKASCALGPLNEPRGPAERC